MSKKGSRVRAGKKMASAPMGAGPSKVGTPMGASKNQTLALISVLRKCRQGEAAVRAASSGGMNFWNMIDSPYLLPGLAAVASALIAYAMATAEIFSFVSASNAVFMLGTIVLTITFVFSFKRVVSSMYFSSDLLALLPLPLSETQVAVAKIASVAERQVLVSACVVVPFVAAFCAGRGVDASFIGAAALGLVLIPVFALSIAGVIIVLLLRFVGFIRNRNLLRFIGAALVVIGGTAFVAVAVAAGRATGKDAVLSLVLLLATVAPALQTWITVPGCLAEFVATGSVVPLLIAVGVTAVCFAVFVVVTKAFYFQGALAMQNTGTASAPLDAAGIKAALKPRSATMALAWRDVKLVLRDPDLLVNTALGSALMAVLIAVIGVPFAFMADGVFLDPCNAVGYGFCMAGITAGVSFARDNPALTAFSREGASFPATAVLPIAPRDLMMGKRYAALILTMGTSMLVLVVALVVAVIAGKLNPVAILFVPGVFVGVSVLIIDREVLKDARRPNFVWAGARYLKVMELSVLVPAAVSLVAFLALALGMAAIIDATGMPVLNVALCVVLTVVLLALGKVSGARVIEQGPRLLGLVPED